MIKTTSKIDFTPYRHAEDPRVILTKNKAIFLAAAASPDYAAAIWRKSHGPPQKRLCWEFLSSSRKSEAYSSPNGRIDLGEAAIDGLGEPQLLNNPLRPLLRNMILTSRGLYSRPKNLFSIFFIANFNLGEHKHDDYDVLNTVIGGPKSHMLGTGWKNPEGRILYTRENDFFHFKPGFKHLNPPLDIERYGERYALVVTAS